MKTVAAISTPSGAGGIGVIRISGDSALEVAGRCFVSVSGKRAEEMGGYTAAFGHVYDGDELIDEGVLLVFRAPKSYTGEDVAEISVHGGAYVTARTLRAALNAGAAPAAPGEFTERAFINGKMDLTQAEAVMTVIGSRGAQALSAAQNALDGAVGREVGSAAEKTASLCAALSVWADYPEDDFPAVDPYSLEKGIEEIKASLERLIAGYDAGLAVMKGVPAVICGRPNVGKSTLMNLLSGAELSIVTDEAGTTRDVVRGEVMIGSVLLNLSDTAGLRRSDNAVEIIGVERARAEMDRAALILAVFDVSEPLNEEDIRLLDYCAGRRAVAVVNKTDKSVKNADVGLIKRRIGNVVFISASTGEGREELARTVEKLLGADDIDTTAPMLVSERQRSLCEKAARCLDNALGALKAGVTLDAVNVELDAALGCLYELTGKRVTEEVAKEVFSKFCVGK